MPYIDRRILLLSCALAAASTARADGVLEIPGGAAMQGSLDVTSWTVTAGNATGATGTARQAPATAPKVGDEVIVSVRFRAAPPQSDVGSSQSAGRVAGDCVKGQHIKEATLKIDGRAYVLGDLVVTSCDATAAAKGDPLKGMLKGHVTLIK